MNYNEALQELQQIVIELQSDTIDIDQLASKTKRAAHLIEFCQRRLRNTEEEIGKLFE
ncbi:MAG: exodeoxyribonuclease VII small subunit [Bacteroidota bacterium]